MTSPEDVMEQHTGDWTPEPWELDGWELKAVTGVVMLTGVRLPAPGNRKQRVKALANARRIVACVNACAGIDTETLEKGLRDNGPLSISALIECASDATTDAVIADVLLAKCAEAEKTYRHDHDHYGRGDLRTGRAWDLMRRAGDKAREYLDARHD